MRGVPAAEAARERRRVVRVAAEPLESSENPCGASLELGGIVAKRGEFQGIRARDEEEEVDLPRAPRRLLEPLPPGTGEVL